MKTKTKLLQEIRIGEIGNCTRCGLCERRTEIVFGRGDANARLMFIGEGPGEEEDLQGLPFVGRAGQLLDDVIRAMQMTPESVYIANVVKCRPPENRNPTAEEQAKCLPFLDRQIDVIRPDVLVALGNVATRALFGEDMRGITTIRGTWKEYRGIPVLLTLHPAFVLRQPTAKKWLWDDAQAVMKRLEIR